MRERYPALVLLGPTGSGKTPLGVLLEQRGVGGHRCVHFDFGEQLREVAARTRPDQILSADDIGFVRGVLAAHALLEDKDFPLAQRLLASLLSDRRADASTIVAMNGLPRHVGQAASLMPLLQVRMVIELACSAETVQQRVAGNTGGDRASRVDDDPAAVAQKLQIFARRTAPLIDYYRELGVRLLTIAVASTMDAETMWQRCDTAYRNLAPGDLKFQRHQR